ncbi:MAG: hypothetical protein ACRDTN_16655 [Mycobacterium sp.]
MYFVDDRPFTTVARIRASVWSYGPNAVASGLAAAWWHDLVTFTPEVVEVTVPKNSHGRARRGTPVRRRDLAGPRRGAAAGARPDPLGDFGAIVVAQRAVAECARAIAGRAERRPQIP